MLEFRPEIQHVPGWPVELLAAGGSEAPHVLLARLGVDVTHPNFWELGSKLLGDMVTEAEGLSAKL